MKHLTCPICGKPTISGIDNEGALVYHLECLKQSDKITAVRQYTQTKFPEKAKKD
jgi:hypothetical protein